ncbi:hypothetical protein Bbelb_017660 [Branchiostoma belcheri]|nr:hypothetical protein Bbelb_017660 [Branchiostoma belcheri]
MYDRYEAATVTFMALSIWERVWELNTHHYQWTSPLLICTIVWPKGYETEVGAAICDHANAMIESRWGNKIGWCSVSSVDYSTVRLHTWALFRTTLVVGSYGVAAEYSTRNPEFRNLPPNTSRPRLAEVREQPDQI